jgi:hypothetical protein
MIIERSAGHGRRDALERSLRAVAEQVRKAADLIDEMYVAGLPDGEGPVLAAKLLRAELLRVKGDLERELARLLLDCRRCKRRVHWVQGEGSDPGHRGHAEPALPTTSPGSDPLCEGLPGGSQGRCDQIASAAPMGGRAAWSGAAHKLQTSSGSGVDRGKPCLPSSKITA